MAGPGGREVGRVSIRVLPDTSRFGISLQRYLDRVEQRARVQVAVTPDTRQFAARLQASVRSAARRVTANVRVGVAGQAALTNLRAQLAEVDGARSTVTLRVRGLARAVRDIRILQRIARDLRRVDIRVGVAGSGRALRQLSDIRRRAEGASVAVRRMRSALNDSGGEARTAAGLLSRFASAAAGVGGSIAKWGSIALVATPAAAGLTAALVEMGPAAALAAPALLALGVAGAAAAVGFRGFGAALKGEKGALANLTPSAQAAVRALRGLRGQLGEIRRAVQERLFKGLASDITGAAKTSLPVFKRGLTDAATGLRAMFLQILSTTRTLSKNGTLGQALKGATTGFKNLSNLPAVLLQGLVQLGAAAAPAFERLTKAGGNALDRLSKRMTAAFENGDMQFYIEQALDVARDFGAVLKNVAGTVSELFKAADVGGGGFLNTLKEITGAIRDAFASPQVQDGLSAIFQTLGELARTVGPLLSEALKAVGPVLAELGPPVQRLISELGKALGPVIKALAPVMAEVGRAVGKLVDAFLPLLPTISDLLVMALEPLAPVIRKVAEVFVRMAPMVARLAEQFGPMLTPILMGLTEVVVQLVSQFGDQLIALMPDLMVAAVELAPVFVKLAESVGEILTELAPLLPQLMSLGTTLIAEVLPAILPLLPKLTELAIAFLDLATGAITKIVIPALEKLMNFISGVRDKMRPFIDAAVEVTEAVVDAFQWLYDTLVGNSIIPDTVREIVDWFAGLPGKAVAALADLVPKLAGKAREAGSRMVSAIRSKVEDGVSTVRTMPSRARDALGDLSSTLYNSGRALLSGFIDGIKSRASDVAGAVGGVLSSARNLLPFSPAKEGPFSGRGWTLYSGRSISEALAEGIRSRQSLVAAATLQLAGAASSNLAGLRGAQFAVAGAGGGVVPWEGPVRLVVDGHEFTAYVDTRAGAVVQRNNGQLATALRAGRG